MDWPIIFAGLSGLFWTATYITIIWVSFKHKTYGMPLFALCANLSWEFIYTFVYPFDGIQGGINITWFFLDLVIAITYLKYGKKHFPKQIPEILFIPNFFFVLFICGSLIYLMRIVEPELADAHSAYGQNMMMCILFVNMLLIRKSSQGQSLYIAIFKMLGTLSAILMAFTYHLEGAYIVKYFSLIAFAYDLIYIMLLYKIIKQEQSHLAPNRIMAAISR